jgi:hypothetical protein
MATLNEGDRFRFAGADGLGQAARIADPDVPEAQNLMRSDMAELDMPAGCEVEVVGHDEDRDLVLVQWMDGQGNPRITSVPELELAAQFEKLEA